MTKKLRVLVVDDSAFARKVLREVLAGDPDVEVVGHARDGLDALEQIAALAPDLVTLDLVMPELDGVGVLRALQQMNSPVRVLVVSMSPADGELAIEALQLGAIDIVQKPTALATDRLYELADEVRRLVRAAAEAQPVRASEPPSARVIVPAASSVRLVAIGTSTGGPRALTEVLSSLPADFPVAIACVVHIPVGYTRALAERIDRASALEVVEAEEGMVLRPGRAVVARAGLHLHVGVRGDELVCALSEAPQTSLHRPSVDELFATTARACGPAGLGVVLTGMGDDGLIGARAIRTAGGRVLTEAEGSCVVYGMPRAVVEAGLSSGVAMLEAMPRAIARAISGE